MSQQLNRASQPLCLTYLAVGVATGLVCGFLFWGWDRPNSGASQVKVSPLPRAETLVESTPPKVRAQEEPAYIETWGNDEKEILDWAKARFHFVSIYRHQVGKRKILAVISDEGMGVPNKSIYLYLQHMDNVKATGIPGWELKLIRYTNSSNITMQAGKNPDQISFRSRSGKIVLSLLVSSLEYTFGPEEQR